MTYQEQLESVQKAIKAIEEGGQSYTIGNRQLNRGNLKELYTREKELRRLVAIENNGGNIRIRYGMPD